MTVCLLFYCPSLFLILQIFGEDIKDASLNEDLLIVAHHNKVFRLYSFEWIIKNCTIVEAKLEEMVRLPNGCAGVVGNLDFGVPITVKLTG